MSSQNEADATSASSVAPARKFAPGELMVLTILVAISSLAFLPIWLETTDQTFARMPQLHGLSANAIEVLRWFSVAMDVAQGLLLGAAGLWLSARIGLVPLRVLLGRPFYRLGPQLRTLLVRSLWLGGTLFLISTAIVVPQLFLVGLKPPPGVSSNAASKHQEVIQVMTKAMSARGAIALALGAPIFEEVEFRLFLLSLIAWLWVRRRPTQNNPLPRAALWTAIAVSAFAFGLAHVASKQGIGWWRPWYVQILSDPRGYVGVVLGYSYWRWGLESSICAHAVLNILVLCGAQIATLVV